MDKKTISAYRQKLSDGLFGVVLPFWEKYGADPVNGGVRTCLDREGKVFSAEKSVWMQGRGGWLFSHVYNDFGHDKRWLDMAESCVKFAKKASRHPHPVSFKKAIQGAGHRVPAYLPARGNR